MKLLVQRVVIQGASSGHRARSVIHLTSMSWLRRDVYRTARYSYRLSATYVQRRMLSARLQKNINNWPYELTPDARILRDWPLAFYQSAQG